MVDSRSTILLETYIESFFTAFRTTINKIKNDITDRKQFKSLRKNVLFYYIQFLIIIKIIIDQTGTLSIPFMLRNLSIIYYISGLVLLEEDQGGAGDKIVNSPP